MHEWTHRNNHDVVLQEDLVSIGGGGPISTLSNDLKKKKKAITFSYSVDLNERKQRNKRKEKTTQNPLN